MKSEHKQQVKSEQQHQFWKVDSMHKVILLLRGYIQSQSYEVWPTTDREIVFTGCYL